MFLLTRTGKSSVSQFLRLARVFFGQLRLENTHVAISELYRQSACLLAA